MLACLLGGLVVLTAGACGGSSRAASAKSQARESCITLEDLGSVLSQAAQSRPVSGEVIDKRLGAAQGFAHNAATLDPRAWSGFRTDLDTFVATLRAGKNPDRAVINRVAGTCDKVHPQITKKG
jgi:hypothetical protein